MYQMLEPVMSNVVCNMNLIYERGGEDFSECIKNSFSVRFPGTASNFETNSTFACRRQYKVMLSC